jgi:putative FmdB family regulatory protein
MPIYDYVCSACGTSVEVMHGVNEAGPAVCIECGGAMRKAMSPPAIVFKGSGWAKKDARRPAPNAGGKSDSADTKPAADGAKPTSSTGGDGNAQTAD